MIKAWVINFLRRLADISIRPYLYETEEEIRREVLAAQYLLPLAGNYIPWSRAALAPSAVATILNDIMLNQRKVILEFGGGISTIYVARLLAKQKAGRLITVEHDMDWAKILEEMLASEGIADRVSLVYAPLTDVKYSLENNLVTSHWYAEEPIATALGDDTIDLLIVDGPNPADDDVYSRYPAMPVLLNKLASSYMVLLDDSGRRGERKVIQTWEVLSGIAFKQIGKYSIALKNSPFKPFV